MSTDLDAVVARVNHKQSVGCHGDGLWMPQPPAASTLPPVRSNDPAVRSQFGYLASLSVSYEEFVFAVGGDSNGHTEQATG